MAKLPAVPSHEADMPNSAKANGDIGKFLNRIQNTPGLDMAAELSKLQAPSRRTSTRDSLNAPVHGSAELRLQPGASGRSSPQPPPDLRESAEAATGPC